LPEFPPVQLMALRPLISDRPVVRQNYTLSGFRDESSLYMPDRRNWSLRLRMSQTNRYIRVRSPESRLTAKEATIYLNRSMSKI